MAYYYGLPYRRRRLPYTLRASAYHRRRNFAYRMRRRRALYKRRSTSKYRYLKYRPSTRPGMRLTNRRRSLGLQPLKLHIKDYQSGWTNFTAYTTSLWSAAYAIDAIQLGDYLEERNSNNVTILPGALKIKFKQPVNEFKTYRIMVIKSFGRRPVYSAYTGILPSGILQIHNTTTDIPNALEAPYSRVDDETANQIKRFYDFKVIYDKKILMDTYNNGLERTILIQLPARNVLYDPDELGGEYWKNGLSLHIITDATAANNNFQYSIWNTLKFTTED